MFLYLKLKYFNLQTKVEVFPKRNNFVLTENVFTQKTFAKRKCFRKESNIVFLFETFFIFCFKKNARNKTFFKVSRMGLGPPYFVPP